MTEVSQGLTVGMAAMYDALAQLMDACVKEVRKSNKIDATDLTLEQVRGSFLSSLLVGTRWLPRLPGSLGCGFRRRTGVS